MFVPISPIKAQTGCKTKVIKELIPLWNAPCDHINIVKGYTVQCHCSLCTTSHLL